MIIIKTKNYMRKINKQSNLLIDYIGNLCRITYLIKMNMKIILIFLLNIWKKQKMNLFYKYEHENKINFFSDNKPKINLGPITLKEAQNLTHLMEMLKTTISVA